MTSQGSNRGAADAHGDPIVIGFVGLGNIGLPMVERLVDDGFTVFANDVSEERLAAVGPGATAVGSLSELSPAKLVGVCVVDDHQVRTVVAGQGGILDSCSPGTTVVVHSTIFPSTVKDLAVQAAERGMQVLDAPISGGDQAARRGELAVMVGGEEDAFRRARPMFDSLGANVFHVGGLGSGLGAKFANQLMTFANQAAALEAMELAEAFGVDEEQMVEVAMAGTAESWCLRNWGFFDRVATSYEEGGTPPRNRPWRKDLWDVVTVARELDLSLPIAGLVSQIGPPRLDGRADSGRTA